MKINILIVEDHELTRFGLKTTFEDVDFIGVIYEASSAEDALEIFKNNPIDVVIMDLGLPNMNGIEATQAIHNLNKDTKIIILTSHNDEKEVLNSLKAGANAYCSKEINLQRLVQVVQSVADGAAWFDPSIAHVVLQATAKSEVVPDELDEIIEIVETKIDNEDEVVDQVLPTAGENGINSDAIKVEDEVKFESKKNPPKISNYKVTDYMRGYSDGCLYVCMSLEYGKTLNELQAELAELQAGTKSVDSLQATLRLLQESHEQKQAE